MALQDKKIMPPPWMAFPEIERYSIGWRMGYGEDYIYRFGDWLDTLSPDEQTEYRTLFPEPVTWKGWWDDEDSSEVLEHGDFWVKAWQPEGSPKYTRQWLQQEFAAGRKRELQTDLAADAIDFAPGTSFDVTAAPERNRFVTLKKCPYFTTNLLLLDGRIERNHVGRDSFAVYMMLDGRMTLSWDKGTETVDRGETVLLPACIEEIGLEGRGKLLEIYID